MQPVITWPANRSGFSLRHSLGTKPNAFRIFPPNSTSLPKTSVAICAGAGLLLLLLCGCHGSRPISPAGAHSAGELRLEFLDAPIAPVIDTNHPDLAGNKYGFEGGSVVKEGGVYHLFAAEMAGDPFWARMRLAHWTSPDAQNWRRAATLYETSGAMDTNDTRFSLWAPMPVFNEHENQWDLFYIAYRSLSSKPAEVVHMDGRVWRAASQVKGRGGIRGPYRDVGTVMQPDAESQWWEGQQGTDSFYPWRVGGKWHAFYGSHNHFPQGPWLVGLAEAPALTGPWKRCAGLNPSTIESKFIENPIVTRIGREFVAIYDSSLDDANPNYMTDGHNVGVSVSADGIHWPPGRRLDVQPGEANWSEDVRTPLCLIPEGNGVYTMLYTGKRKGQMFWPVGLVRLKIATAN
jgi:hypothetical protein